MDDPKALSGRPAKLSPRARPRGRALYVWVTEEERAAIEERATASALSVSAYLRTLGLSYEPRSVYDARAVIELARVNGDQGRLGGLLKMWLSTRRGEGAPVQDVEKLLGDIAQAQRLLRDRLDALKVTR
jgi:hypothetical protein